MKRLLKQYELNSDMQYFEYCVESYVNGQHEQARELFQSMNKEDRKRMVRAMLTGWDVSDKTTMFFFDII